MTLSPSQPTFSVPRAAARALALAAVLLTGAAVAPSAASAAPSYTVNKTIQQTDPLTDRPSRNGQAPSACGVVRPFAGPIGFLGFNTVTSTFMATQSGCLSITQPASSVCSPYLAVYDAALYNPNDPSSGYVGDAGNSADTGPQAFSVDVVAGKTYTLIFTAADGTPSGGCPTSATLSGVTLTGADFGSPTLTAQDSRTGSGMVRATYLDATGAPVVGRNVIFTTRGQNGQVNTLCTARTNANGLASCKSPFPQLVSARPVIYTASADGLSSTAILTYLPTSAPAQTRSAASASAKTKAAKKRSAKKRDPRAKRVRVASHR